MAMSWPGPSKLVHASESRPYDQYGTKTTREPFGGSTPDSKSVVVVSLSWAVDSGPRMKDKHNTNRDATPIEQLVEGINDRSTVRWVLLADLLEDRGRGGGS